MKLFFAYLHNTADSQDDEVLKIKAKTKSRALDLATDYIERHGRFTLGEVMRRKRLKRAYPDWHALLWGLPAIGDSGDSYG